MMIYLTFLYLLVCAIIAVLAIVANWYGGDDLTTIMLVQIVVSSLIPLINLVVFIMSISHIIKVFFANSETSSHVLFSGKRAKRD